MHYSQACLLGPDYGSRQQNVPQRNSRTWDFSCSQRIGRKKARQGSPIGFRLRATCPAMFRSRFSAAKNLQRMPRSTSHRIFHFFLVRIAWTHWKWSKVGHYWTRMKFWFFRQTKQHIINTEKRNFWSLCGSKTLTRSRGAHHYRSPKQKRFWEQLDCLNLNKCFGVLIFRDARIARTLSNGPSREN